MSYQFNVQFFCRRSNRTVLIGVDSRIMLNCKERVTWQRDCFCGRKVRVTRFGKMTNIQHVEEKLERADNVINLAEYRQKVLPFKRKK